MGSKIHTSLVKFIKESSENTFDDIVEEIRELDIGDLKGEIIEWVKDGNVVYVDGTYRTQDAQYNNRLKTIDDLVSYYRREFIKESLENDSKETKKLQETVGFKIIREIGGFSKSIEDERNILLNYTKDIEEINKYVETKDVEKISKIIESISGKDITPYEIMVIQKHI